MARSYYRYEESHRTVNGVKQKRCTKCKKWKKESEFVKKSSQRDGLDFWCKECKRADMRERNKKDGKGLKKYLRYEEHHRIVDGVKQKRCSRCKRWKSESEFYKTRWHKDGLAGWCKECADKATNRARRKRLLALRNLQQHS